MRQMKKKLLIGLVAIVFILDWLALDDITTGNEPNYVGEYAILVISVPILLFFGYKLWKQII